MHTQAMPKQFQLIVSVDEIQQFQYAIAISTGMSANTIGQPTKEILLALYNQLGNTLKQN